MGMRRWGGGICSLPAAGGKEKVEEILSFLLLLSFPHLCLFACDILEG